MNKLSGRFGRFFAPSAVFLLAAVILPALIYAAGGNRESGQAAAGIPASTGAITGFVASDQPAIESPGVVSTLGASPAGPCPGPWVVRAPVPYNARGIFAASDGNFIFGGGGYDGTSVRSDLKKYDPATNTWSSLASSPDAHFLSPAVYSPVTNKVYNFGGFNAASIATTTTRIYDVATNTWTTGAPMPAARTDEAAALYNGIVYVAGGINTSGGAVNTLFAYDIAGNSWSTLAPLPQALFLPGFGAINGKVYIASGNTGGGELTTLYIYDIAANTWSTGAVVPHAVTGPGSTVFEGLLYLYGGGFPTTTKFTQVYDPVANTWSPGPDLNVNRLWFYGSAFATGIVAPGGDTTPGIPVNANEQLNCNSLSGLSPAKVWVGLANSDDVGIKFDLQANVYVNGSLVGTGHLDSVPGGSSGFNNAKLDSIPLALTGGPVPVSSGDTFSIQVLARNACVGSGHNSGRARLWYNGQPTDTGATRDAGSRFDATIGGLNSDYYLRTGAALSTTAGNAKATADVQAGPKCGPFVSFGTWTTTLN